MKRHEAKGRATGQSTLEYLMVVIAVLALILLAVGSIIKPRVDTQMSHAGNLMNSGVQRFQNSLGTGL